MGFGTLRGDGGGLWYFDLRSLGLSHSDASLGSQAERVSRRAGGG